MLKLTTNKTLQKIYEVKLCLEKLKKGMELLEEIDPVKIKYFPGHELLEKVIAEFYALISLIENLIKKLNDPNIMEEKIDEYLGWIIDLTNQIGREDAAKILKQLNFFLTTFGRLSEDVKEMLDEIIMIAKAAQKELLERNRYLESLKAGHLKKEDLPVMPALIVPSSKRQPPYLDQEIRKIREQMESADFLRRRQLQRQLDFLEDQKRTEAEKKLNEAIERYMNKGQKR